MKTVTVKVEFQMPVGHLDADSILDIMQGRVEKILEDYGEMLSLRQIDKLVNEVSVEIVDAKPVPSSDDDVTG
jgi:hypothetical protein